MAPNQIIYRDVFEGVRADWVITLRRSGLEADLVLREVPPDPVEFQFAPELVRVEVVTEFFDPPEPTRKTRVLDEITDPVLRNGVAQPDWMDEDLDFGVCRIGQGRAFAWSQREAAIADPDKFPRVGKRWVRTDDGREALIESVEYVHLFDELMALSGPESLKKQLEERARAWTSKDTRRIRNHALGSLLTDAKSADVPATAEVQNLAMASNLPQRPTRGAMGQAPERVLLGKMRDSEEPGLVIDWMSVVTGSSNVTFRADRTYLVSGTCNLLGTTTFEGGTVIKYTNGATSCLRLNGPVVCSTGPYRPAVLTACDDNSVGESIVAGTPVPTNDYAWASLWLKDTGTPILLEHLRIKHAKHGIYFEGNNPSNVVRHCQWVNCQITLRDDNAKPVRVQNGLLHVGRPGSFGFYSPGGQPGFVISGEHLTIVGCEDLLSNGSLALTNCLLVGVTNIQSHSAANNSQSTSIPAGTFQTAGGGAFYLPAGSPNRDAGTTNVESTLLAQIRHATTRSPHTLTGTVQADLSLAPLVEPDFDLPDRGYHYPRADYLIQSLTVTNAAVTLWPGTVVAVIGNSGFVLDKGSRLYSHGTVGARAGLLRYHCLQEGHDPLGAQSGSSFDLIKIIATNSSGSAMPSVELRWTDVYHQAISTNSTIARSLLNSTPPLSLSPVTIVHSTFHGIFLNTMRSLSDNCIVSLTNNLFESCYTYFNNALLGAPLTLHAYNNLFLGDGGAVLLANWRTNAWYVRDNLFASGTLSGLGTNYLNLSNNGYGSGVYNVLGTGGANAKTNLTIAFASGPLGPYYYPTNGGSTSLTNLLDAGSRTAINAGLYHHTVRADVAKEANSKVDIGYHYPASNAGGTATDTDGDGLPDADEDLDGNGIFDSGESDWQTSSSFPGASPWLLPFTPLRQ